MVMPAYSVSGAYSAVFGFCGTIDPVPNLPFGCAAGDIIIGFCAVRAGTSVSAISTPFGFTSIYSAGATTFRTLSCYKVADGTEDFMSTVQFSSTYSGTSPRGIAELHLFKNTNSSSVDTIGGTNTGSSTTASFSSLTTTLSNELAVGLVGIQSATTIGSNTGETGGDWTEANPETSAVTLTIQLQTAQMTTAGTLSGGSSTIGVSSAWHTHCFALKEVAGGGILISKPPMLRHHIFR